MSAPGTPSRGDRAHQPDCLPEIKRRRRPLGPLDDIQLAWLAGLLEGEGYFRVISSTKKAKTYKDARVGISMTDRDVVARVAALFDAAVMTVKPSGVSRLPQFRTVLVDQRALP